MNIFALDDNPIQAAKDQCNKHVVKMIVESAQLLCTALHINGINIQNLPYRPTHSRHPSTIWTSSSNNNIAWLWAHAHALCNEYTNRYKKTHKTSLALNAISHLIPNGNWQKHTPFAMAMPEQWKCSDAVTAYRCYYIAEKSRFAKWAPRAVPPTWWPFKEIDLNSH